MTKDLKNMFAAVLLVIALLGTFAYAATPKMTTNYGPMPLCPLGDPNCDDNDPPAMLQAPAHYGPMPLCPLNDPNCDDNDPPVMVVISTH